jgi:hypothetical protein
VCVNLPGLIPFFSSPLEIVSVKIYGFIPVLSSPLGMTCKSISLSSIPFSSPFFTSFYARQKNTPTLHTSSSYPAPSERFQQFVRRQANKIPVACAVFAAAEPPQCPPSPAVLCYAAGACGGLSWRGSLMRTWLLPGALRLGRRGRAEGPHVLPARACVCVCTYTRMCVYA